MHVVDVAPTETGDWVVELDQMPQATKPTKREAKAAGRLLAERRRAKLRIRRSDGSLQRTISRYRRGWAY